MPVKQRTLCPRHMSKRRTIVPRHSVTLPGTLPSHQYHHIIIPPGVLASLVRSSKPPDISRYFRGSRVSKVSGAWVSYALRSNRLKKGGRVCPFSYYEARNVYCILLLLDDRGEKVSVFKVGFYWIKDY